MIPLPKFCATCRTPFNKVNVPEGADKFRCPGCNRIIKNTMDLRCPGCMSMCQDSPTLDVHTRYCEEVVRQ